MENEFNSRKIEKSSHPDLIFNNNQVIQSPYQTLWYVFR